MKRLNLVVVIIAVMMTVGAQPLWASSAATTSEDDASVASLRSQMLDLFRGSSELEGQIAALQEKGAVKDGQIARLTKENDRLRQQIRSLGEELGLTQRKLEEAESFMAGLKAEEPTSKRQAEVWKRALEDSSSEIAKLEKEVASLKGKITQGETRVVENLKEAGLPPVFLAVAKCGEGDWACAEFTRSSVKAHPDPRVYRQVLVVPSFSPAGLYTGLPEPRQMELSKRRGETVAGYYAGQGYEVKVGKPIKGMSAAFLTFSATGCGMVKLEREIARLDGGLERAFKEIRGLDRRMYAAEVAITDLDRRAGANLAPGVGIYATSGGFSYIGDLRLEIPTYNSSWYVGLTAGAGATTESKFSWTARAQLMRALQSWGAIGGDVGVLYQGGGDKDGRYTLSALPIISAGLGPLEFGVGAGVSCPTDSHKLGWIISTRVSLLLFR